MRIARALLFGLLMVSAVTALADGDVRPATAGEKACMGKILGIFSKACLQGPPGWTRTEEGDATAPDVVSGTGPGRPMEIRFDTTWKDQKRLQAFEREAMNSMTRQAQSGSMDNIMKQQEKMQPLIEQMTAAAQKGDTAKMQALQKQLEAMQKESTASMNAANKPFEDERKAKTPKDATLKVSFETNTFWVSASAKPLPEAPIGAAQIYRIADEGFDNEQWHEGTTVALLGAWRLAGQTDGYRFEAPRRGGTTCTILTVAVRVQGDKVRARKFLEGVDWTGVKALMQ